VLKKIRKSRFRQQEVSLGLLLQKSNDFCQILDYWSESDAEYIVLTMLGMNLLQLKETYIERSIGLNISLAAKIGMILTK